MKETNERAVIQLLHGPTSEYVDFYISEEATTSVIYIEDSITKLRKPLTDLLTKMKSDEAEGLSKQEYKKIDEISAKIHTLRMDELEIILTPKDGIPGEYDNDLREYLEDCVPGLEVINAIVDFFWKQLGSTTELHEDSRPPIRILDRNGDEWESPISKALQRSKNSTD